MKSLNVSGELSLNYFANLCLILWDSLPLNGMRLLNVRIKNCVWRCKYIVSLGGSREWNP